MMRGQLVTRHSASFRRLSLRCARISPLSRASKSKKYVLASALQIPRVDLLKAVRRRMRTMQLRDSACAWQIRFVPGPYGQSARVVKGRLKLFVSIVSAAKARSPAGAINGDSSSMLSLFHRAFGICRSKFASTHWSSRSNTTRPSMSTPKGHGLSTLDSTARIPADSSYRGYRRPASVGGSTDTLMLLTFPAPASTALDSI
jgi:hypothetical protein